MKLLESYTALVTTEIEYAHFNAMRTSLTYEVSRISWSKSGDVPVLLEPGKPANPYYNRAVLPADLPEGCDVEAMMSQSRSTAVIHWCLVSRWRRLPKYYRTCPSSEVAVAPTIVTSRPSPARCL